MTVGSDLISPRPGIDFRLAYSPCQKARDDGSGNAALLVLRAFNGQGYVEVR
eukprot:COSAG04_NODE_19666_length_410_cov_1.495177_1_plen_51_part_10